MLICKHVSDVALPARLVGLALDSPTISGGVRSNSKAFSYLTICVLALEAAEFSAEWLTDSLSND